MTHLVAIIVSVSAMVFLGHCELEDADAQEWCPVKCTCEVKARERIIANCSKQNYTSIPPHFPKLNSLNFSHNQISEVRNVNFKDENLRHIQNIDLSNNKIQNIEMKSFEHLTQLRYLDLSSNKISSVSPESFKKLKKLDILDLRGNSIQCLALKNELPWVNILCNSSEEYAYDKVREWCPSKCTCEVKAKERIIANCSKQNYTSIPPHFPKLNSLNFSHNQISEVRNINFKDENLRHIQNIDLSNNKIQNIETESFELLTQLRCLDISSNKIRSVSPESFKKLKKLDILDLRGNSIDCMALKNELPWVNVLCSSSNEYAYDTTMATATLTKASDSNMEIPEGSYTDDTVVTTATLLRTESSNMIERHFDSETATKTNMNDTEVQITTSTKNYNSTLFGVTEITHRVAAVQHTSTVPAINEDTSAAQNGISIGITMAALVLIGVCAGRMLWCRKHKCKNVKEDPEGELPVEGDNEKLLLNSSSRSFTTVN
jgi:hypothetical protein